MCLYICTHIYVYIYVYMCTYISIYINIISVDVPPEEGSNPVEGSEDRPVSTLGYVLCIYMYLHMYLNMRIFCLLRHSYFFL
jgi:hypothetical protein